MCTDHPRACGANKYVPLDMKPADGSSPRVRGKHGVGDRGGYQLRIIPARAGQTCAPVSSVLGTPDHPRACGANAYKKTGLDRRTGSSPRVRGKPIPVTDVDWETRIIPARAGQTPSVF